MTIESNNEQASRDDTVLIHPAAWQNAVAESLGLRATQDKLLSRVDGFAADWFERHQAGAHAGVLALRRMVRTRSPVEATVECQTWARGVFERAMADGAALQSLLLKSVGDFVAQSSRQDPEPQDRSGHSNRSA